MTPPTAYRQGHSGLPRQGWAMAPERLTIALQDAGWRVRLPMTWNRAPHKQTVACPECRHEFEVKRSGQYVREDPKHVKRPRRGSERLFLLGPPGKWLPRFDHERLAQLPVSEQGDVWTFPPAHGPGRQARFPLELPHRCLFLTAKPGDLVLDPYAGEGTTAEAAVALGLDSVLIDLDPTAVRLGRLAPQADVWVDGTPVFADDLQERVA